MHPVSPIPCTVLVGFLGSGKTTVLNQLLKQLAGERVAVIVNEFGSINVDATVVRQTTENVVEMSNGCICCTLREDLLKELEQLAQLAEPPTHIFIESTGIGEPLPIAQTFHMGSLPSLVVLDEILSVVDTPQFWKTYETSSRNPETGAVESLANLLTDQLEFATTILLNKVDACDVEAADKVQAFARRLNPHAVITKITQGYIPVDQVIGTRRYSYTEALEHEAWEREWNKPSSEAEEYGFSSFVFRSEKPLRWAGFQQFLSDFWPAAVLRSKGSVVFADNAPIIFQQAGDSFQGQQLVDDIIEGGTNPWTVPEGMTTEIVFIGQHLPEKQIRLLLEKLVVR